MTQQNSKTQGVEQLYMDYLQTAKTLQKKSTKQIYPYLILGGVFLCGGLSSIFWAGFRTLANLIFWGVVLSLVIDVVGIFVQTKWQNDEAARIAQSKPGFAKFFKLFRQWRWPKQMPKGKEYDKFVALIGTPVKPAVSATSTSPASDEQLTEEEQRFLALLAKGLSDDQIAETLYVPCKRIPQTRNELFHKFGVNRDDDLIWEAKQKGYLQPN
jgi:DNA-binding CsgD family transcriptional regulator